MAAMEKVNFKVFDCVLVSVSVTVHKVHKVVQKNFVFKTI